jgi:hypothetical protein
MTDTNGIVGLGGPGTTDFALIRGFGRAPVRPRLLPKHCSRSAIGYNRLGNRCSPENRGKLKDAIFRCEKIDYGEEFGDSAHQWNS